MSNFVLNNSRQYNSCNNASYTDPNRSPRYRQEIFFIIPAIPQWLSTASFYQIQFQMSFCGENPSLIFFIDSKARATTIIPLAPSLIQMISKLFVLGLSDQTQVDMYVFWHPCGSYPLRWIKHYHTNSFKEWEFYNHKLNEMRVSTGQGPHHPIEASRCVRLYYSNKPIPLTIACLQLTLGKL